MNYLGVGCNLAGGGTTITLQELLSMKKITRSQKNSLHKVLPFQFIVLLVIIDNFANCLTQQWKILVTWIELVARQSE